MEIKTVNAQPAISLHLKTKLNSIHQDVADKPEQLMHALASANISPTGPMVFVYRNMTPNPSAIFDLEIALPVSSTKGYKGVAKASTLGKLHYVETVHKGDLQSMGEQTYPTFFGAIKTANLQVGSESREVYTHFVDAGSADNITHIQVGVQD